MSKFFCLTANRAARRIHSKVRPAAIFHSIRNRAARRIHSQIRKADLQLPDMAIFYPNHYVSSAYGIPYRELYARGKRALIFDIDNTLVEHGAPANERAIALMEHLKGLGFEICLLSNNKEPRVKSFNEKIGVSYVFKAGKPRRSGYERAMRQMGSSKETTVFIGDQIFTDVWGANLAGIETYLVKPIDKKEEFQIVLKRWLEKPILYFYKRSRRKRQKQ